MGSLTIRRTGRRIDRSVRLERILTGHGREMLVQVANWKTIDWLRHGFSTRRGGISTVYQSEGDKQKPNADGDLNLGWTKEDDPSNVAENRRRLISAVSEAGDTVPRLISLRQIHSASSLIVSDIKAASSFMGADGRALLEADGLMTRAAGFLLGTQTADCVPVLVVDMRLRAIACFHAGWRGTAARIVERGVCQMVAEFGSRQEDLVAAVGPSIGACCYSVGEEVLGAFGEGFSYGQELFRKETGPGAPLYLDLWKANQRQLIESGVSALGITVVGECTSCAGLPNRREYFSHRRERGFTGRMLSVIGIAEGLSTGFSEGL